VWFVVQEHSWEDHGYPFLNSLYPDLGPLLDDKFKLALQMTYRRCVHVCAGSDMCGHVCAGSDMCVQGQTCVYRVRHVCAGSDM